ncbi:hypothetical protein, partial [Candidatus Thiosymbion oneisti]|uniref:hypothetical protein n=1 Tax=Candidatus Thiosymbion oneisti TaxID=589554 RepID=UPI001C40867B
AGFGASEAQERSLRIRPRILSQSLERGSQRGSYYSATTKLEHYPGENANCIIGVVSAVAYQDAPSAAYPTGSETLRGAELPRSHAARGNERKS